MLRPDPKYSHTIRKRVPIDETWVAFACAYGKR